MFSIRNEPFGPFEKYILQNLHTGEYASIIPDFGGNVNELVLKKKEKLYSVLDGNKTAKELIKDEAYKGAHLIPFSGRIKDGMYIFQGKPYQLPINETSRNNALHGFLNDKPFSIAGITENKDDVSLKLAYSYESQINGYPFPFHLLLIYTISGSGLKIGIEVKNTGASPMPFACGWHPYFTFHEPVDELHLQVPGSGIVALNEHLIPTGEMIPPNHFTTMERIGSARLDTCFLLKDNGKAETLLHSVEKDITIHVWQESGNGQFRYMQVYIPPHRRSIAIEPVTSQPNAFNNRNGLVTLQPAEAFRGSYGVYIR